MKDRRRRARILVGLLFLGVLGCQPAGAVNNDLPPRTAWPEIHPASVDEDGNLKDSDRDAILKLIVDQKTTDVFIFSHGWLNQNFQAMTTYGRVRDLMSGLADERKLRPEGFRPLLIGILWPSTDFEKQFNDFDTLVAQKMIPDGASPGEESKVDQVLASSLTAITGSDSSKAKAATKPGIIDRFRSALVDSKGKDPGQAFQSIYSVFVDQSATLRSSFKVDDLARYARLLEGPIADASTLAQVHTFWKMRMRAGVVGSKGVHEMVASIQKNEMIQPSIHLIGHSFGCKVVMAAITAYPGLPRPVNSVVLIQGAISEQSFADKVADLKTEGAYFVAQDPSVVRGPIVATSSKWDQALSYWFPRASLVGRQVGELNVTLSIDEMVHLTKDPVLGPKFDLIFGALGGGSKGSPMKKVGEPYDFGRPGSLNRINGDDVIVGGKPPGGAHGEFDKPEVAWLIWSAALAGRAGPR